MPREHKNAHASDGITVALIYTRVSSEDQANEGLSLDAQLTDCRRYAAELGWMIGNEYQDVMSGKRADRPEYQALLAEARRLRGERKNVVVVVKWLHRFGRRLAERVRCWEEFKRLSVELHSVSENGAVSEFVANILATVAQEEARQLSERVSETWRHTRSLGWYQVGRAPWGYKWRPRTDEERSRGAPKLVLEPDSVAAPYVRELFERAAGGESARSVARWAATLPADVRRGQSLRQDRVMSWRAVYRTITNPVYIARDCGSRDQTPPPAEVVAHTRGQWPALVDESTWMNVQERLASHKRVPHQATARYLLTGFIRCSLCGQRMQGMVQSRGPRYRCGAWARGARATPCSFVAPSKGIDAQVIAEVTALLDVVTNHAPAVQAALRQAWRALEQPDQGEAAQRVQRLEIKIKSLQERVVRATELFCDGQIDKASYDALCARASGDSDAAREELARLRAVETRPVLPPLDEVREAARSWAACFSTVDTKAHRPHYSMEQRDVLAALIERVVPARISHGKYRVEIGWTALGTALRAVKLKVLQAAA